MPHVTHCFSTTTFLLSKPLAFTFGRRLVRNLLAGNYALWGWRGLDLRLLPRHLLLLRCFPRLLQSLFLLPFPSLLILQSQPLPFLLLFLHTPHFLLFDQSTLLQKTTPQVNREKSRRRHFSTNHSFPHTGFVACGINEAKFAADVFVDSGGDIFFSTGIELFKRPSLMGLKPLLECCGGDDGIDMSNPGCMVIEGFTMFEAVVTTGGICAGRFVAKGSTGAEMGATGGNTLAGLLLYSGGIRLAVGTGVSVTVGVMTGACAVVVTAGTGSSFTTGSAIEENNKPAFSPFATLGMFTFGNATVGVAGAAGCGGGGAGAGGAGFLIGAAVAVAVGRAGCGGNKSEGLDFKEKEEWHSIASLMQLALDRLLALCQQSLESDELLERLELLESVSELLELEADSLEVPPTSTDLLSSATKLQAPSSEEHAAAEEGSFLFDPTTSLSPFFGGFFADPSCPVTSCSRFSNSCFFSAICSSFDLPGSFLSGTATTH
ncbi:hypothetical protein C0J52_03925 [Blattella germanica]|nr:hypothetical protein C0J52_03925 [Blattella germanica]